MSLSVCAGCSAAYAVGLPACPQCGSTDQRESGRDLAVPAVQVACRAAGCRACGQVRRVRLAAVDQYFVQAPVLLCAACGSPAEIVMPWPLEREEPMPKITKHGGASNALADPPAPAEPEPSKEEVASSPGSSSQTSPEKPEPSPKAKPPAPRKRARTTGSRSKAAQTGSSTARSTGGGQTEPTSQTD